jgi:Spy/CpxP family protein refolding chaperone
MTLTNSKLPGTISLISGIIAIGSLLCVISTVAAQTESLRMGTMTQGVAASEEANPLTSSVPLLSYLHDKRVQQELKLTEKQLADIKKVIRDIRDRHKKELESALPQAGEGGLPPPRGFTGKQDSGYWKIAEKIDVEAGEALRKALPDILRKDQRTRLREISWQERQLLDLSIFLDQEVVRSLKLTKEQQQRIHSIGKAMSAEFAKRMRQEPSRSPIPAGASISLDSILTIVKASREKVLTDVLTDTQKKKWKGMLGKRYHFGWEPEEADTKEATTSR